ncbi:unnamed protein product [Microthlaspi erraticum]|uniref:CCHC-type domain-containing protein n=1 Tax=Microthlaspi erraticum TaxID=1685480 RepID=A0A6D2HN05_9BRAS|nr:unnamed protein product [Microthlaspi erraticum]
MKHKTWEEIQRQEAGQETVEKSSAKIRTKKTAMGTALDTDNMDLDEIVDDRKDIQELKNEMSLMAKNFSKALKRVERGRKKPFSKQSSGERDNDRTWKKSDQQCHECRGYGHFKSECPTAKRKEIKCFECKGFGHTKAECSGSDRKGNE